MKKLPVGLGATILLTLVLALPAFAQDAVEPATKAPFALALVMRWAHILSAVVLMGGTFFARVVLLPAAEATLDADTHAKLRAAVRQRWAKWVHLSLLLFLISGFYTYLFITAPAHPNTPLYHALFGVKFLLALVIFFFASVLAGRSGLAQKLQAKPRLWVTITLLLALAVVGIAGVMKLLP